MVGASLWVALPEVCLPFTVLAVLQHSCSSKASALGVVDLQMIRGAAVLPVGATEWPHRVQHYLS